MASDQPRPEPGETLDRLAGNWRIFQLRRGHRFATDDLLTAWTAWRAQPGAERVLDLGCGVGSIGLLVLRRLSPSAQLTSVEVQAVSAELARKTVAFNGLQRRVRIINGDLRADGLLRDAGVFELVTANPPYIPPHRGVAAPHPQRAAARLELHGDIRDFCRRAAAHLAPGGRFCFSHAAADPRPPLAVRDAGMRVLCRREVLFRQGRAPTIALYTCAWEGETVTCAPLVVRGADGAWSPGHSALRLQMEIDP